MEEEKQSFFKRRKKEIILASIALLLVAGVAYAWLSQTITSDNKNVVVAGKLRLTILNEDPIIRAGGEDGYAIPMADTYGLATKPYTFTVENTGDVAASYEVSLSDATSYTEKNTTTDEYGYSTYTTTEQQIYNDSERISDTKIRYNIREGSNTNTDVSFLSDKFGRVLISGTLSPGQTKTYNLRLWIDQEATQEDLNDKVFAANLVINGIQQMTTTKNQYIKAVYKYNENGEGTGAAFTGCLGGAESGCQDISSQVTKLTNYPTGTVIKYEVKSGTELYFNVLHDDGDILTLQHRENTVSNVAWYGTSSDYTSVNGPDYTNSGYALYELEQATNSWTNVKEQTYSIGDNTTTLGYSGCDNNTCYMKKYQLERTSKVRMITRQELSELGCTTTNQTCQRFINNYLTSSTSYGGTFATGNYYYWTMSAQAGGTANAWLVHYGRRYFASNIYTATNNGARAVVVIDK